MELKHCFTANKTSRFVFLGAPEGTPPPSPETHKDGPVLPNAEAKETAGLKIPSPEEVYTFLNAHKDELVRDVMALKYKRDFDSYRDNSRLYELANMFVVLPSGGRQYIANFLENNIPRDIVETYTANATSWGSIEKAHEALMGDIETLLLELSESIPSFSVSSHQKGGALKTGNLGSEQREDIDR